jgi:hypothetical protein
MSISEGHIYTANPCRYLVVHEINYVGIANKPIEPNTTTAQMSADRAARALSGR